MLRSSILALGLWAAWGALPGCDDGPGPGDDPPPGLQILTPRVGGAAGALASVLLRSDQPARVSISRADGGAELLGTGRTGRDAAAIRFTVPADLGAGTAALTVTAVSDGGTSDTQQFTVEGLGELETQALADTYFDVAALPGRAVLASTDGLYTVVHGWVEPVAGPVGEVQAIAADEAADVVLVSGDNALVTTYEVSYEGELTPGAEFNFADYDSSMLQLVTHVNALHVNGALVAAATSQGMALMDRATVSPEGEPFCRTRSAMTATLVDTNFDGAMFAVVVTPGERLLAGGAYVNVYSIWDGTVDPGGCNTPFPSRGTAPVFSPEGATLPWNVVAATTTESFVWIGRSEQGVVRVLLDFVLTETNRSFREADSMVLEAEIFPFPFVVDIAPGLGDQLWVAVADRDRIRGGVTLVGSDGALSLYVDADALGGVPLALDTVEDADHALELWILTSNGITNYTISI